MRSDSTPTETQSPLDSLRSTPGWLLTAVVLSSAMCASIIYTAMTPVLPMLADFFGGGVEGALLSQLVMTMPGLGLMLGGPASGWLVERWGTRPVMVSALVLYVITGSAGLYLSTPTELLASRFFLGVAAASFTTASLTLLSERFNPIIRARMLGYHSACGAAIGLLAILASGAVADIGGWRMPFSFYLLGGVVLVMALVAVPAGNTRGTGTPKAPAGSLLALWPLYLLYIPLYITIFTTTVQVPFLLRAEGIVSASMQSQIIAVGVLGHLLGAWFFGSLRQRLGDRGTLMLGLGLMAGGHIILGLTHGALLAAAGCLITSLGSGTLAPHLTNILIERSPEHARSRAIGLLASSQFLGSILNPVTFAPLTATLGIHGAMVAVGSVLAVSTLMVMVIRRV